MRYKCLKLSEGLAAETALGPTLALRTLDVNNFFNTYFHTKIIIYLHYTILINDVDENRIKLS